MGFRLFSPILLINNNKGVSARFMGELLDMVYVMMMLILDVGVFIAILFLFLKCFLSTFLIDNLILAILFTVERQIEYLQMTLSLHTHKLNEGK